MELDTPLVPYMQINTCRLWRSEAQHHFRMNASCLKNVWMLTGSQGETAPLVF